MALPGKIRSYDATAGTAEVEIQVRRVLPSGDETSEDVTEEYPILPGVPVIFPQATGSGGGYLAIRLRPGDLVWIMFSEADLGQWRATGEVSDPGLATRHGLSGAMCIPGARHRAQNAPDLGETAQVKMGADGGPAVEVDADFVRAGGVEFLAKSDPVDAILHAVVADLAAIAAILNTAGPVVGAPGAVTVTTGTVMAANPIATSTLLGG